MRLHSPRLDPGLLLGGVMAALLLPLMFRPWFCLPAGSAVAEDTVAVTAERCYNAWVSFATVDLLLAFSALAVILVVLMVLFGIGLPVLPGPLITVIGVFSFLLVSLRLIFPPWGGASRAAAPFLALLLLAGVAAGGWLSTRLQTRAGETRKGGRAGVSSRDSTGGFLRRWLASRPRKSEAEFKDFNREMD